MIGPHFSSLPEGEWEQTAVPFAGGGLVPPHSPRRDEPVPYGSAAGGAVPLSSVGETLEPPHTPRLSPFPRREGGQGVRSPICHVLLLGRVEYAEAWEIQRQLGAARRAGEIEDVLILLEHPHVYTLGRRADETHVLADAARLAEIGATLFRIDRGGDVTYHGPGQIVGYPILDLRERGGDVHQYVHDLEETLIRTIADYGVAAGRRLGYPGVWVGEEKVAAIGVKVAHWITSHGFALNVDPDLAYFGEIVPCGLHDAGVASLTRLLGRTIAIDDVATRLAQHFSAVFGSDLVPSVLVDLLPERRATSLG